MDKLSISAVLITFNEERMIEQVLEKLNFCSEIIVVDSGSTDRTQEICERFKAKFLYRKFDGFGDQKRYAVEQASHDWVLCLDADEVLEPSLLQSIQEKFSDPSKLPSGFYLYRSLVFMGKKLHFGRVSKEKILRLFNKTKGNYNLAAIHEKVELKGEIQSLEGELIHYSYRDLSDYFQRFNRYTSMMAKTIIQKNKSTHPLALIVRFPLNFLTKYILHGSILDGFPGFIWALNHSFYHTIKYAKAWESKSDHQIKL